MRYPRAGGDKKRNYAGPVLGLHYMVGFACCNHAILGTENGCDSDHTLALRASANLARKVSEDLCPAPH